MACRESGDSKVLLCLGLFLVASSFCHCTRLTNLKGLDILRGNLTLGLGQAKGSELSNGRLLIGQNTLQGAKLKGIKATKNLLEVDTDYQADMGWWQPKQPTGEGDGLSRLKSDNAAVEKLLKMEPKVECTEGSMKLQVQDASSTSTPGSLFFVDRGLRLSPLPLSKLPPSCGYTIKSTQRDLVLVAPYDGCFVTVEEDSYVLPLLWWGLPVRMSCPLMRQSSSNPPMVTCHAEGMVVKMEWAVSVAKIKVKLTGNWEPLMEVSPRCGFSVVVHPEGVVISVRYEPCLEPKDGMYTLELGGNGETIISCPLLSPAQTETPSKGMYEPDITPNNPSQSGHKVPIFSQNPDVPNKKPNQGPKDIGQPQLPTLPFNHNFFYPYPANPDTKLTVQPTHPPVTRKNGLQSQQNVPPVKVLLKPEGQVPKPFIPLPFYHRPAQPGVPQATQQPSGQEKQPFYAYPFFVKPPNPEDIPPAHKPELKPLPSAYPPVVKTTKGQRWNPFTFFPQQPKLETPPTQRPITKSPLGTFPNLFNGFGNLPGSYPSKPTNPEQASWPIGPSASQPEGQEHKPLYPLPFYPQQPREPTFTPQVEPLYPLYPEKQLPQQPVLPKPSVSKEPQGQIYQTLYPFVPQGPHQMPVPPTQLKPKLPPKNQVQQPLSPWLLGAFKPQVPQNVSPIKKPQPQPEAPQGQVDPPFYPYPFYTPPEPGNQMPNAFPKPPATETPKGQVHKPSYPQSSKIPDAGANGEQSKQPPAVEPSEGQVPHPFNPYYYPQRPQPVNLPPSTSVQQPQQVQQGPQLGSSFIPPVYCPQFCPSGFSNCCPQIAYHQHLHHIVSAELGSKDTPPVYTGLPFFPSVANSGFVNSFGSAPLSQMQTEAITTQESTSAPISPQSLPSGNEKQPHLQPPDGNPSALPGGYPSKPTNPEQPIYHYFVSNSEYPYVPQLPLNEKLQNVPSGHLPAHSGVLPKPQVPGKEPVNPVVQYEQNNEQPPMQQNSQLSAVDRDNPSWSNFMSFISKYLLHRARQQRKPTVEEMQPAYKISSDSIWTTDPEVQSELDHLLVPYYMLQDAEAPTYNNKTIPNNSSHPFVSGSKKSNRHEHSVNTFSEPKTYVLLQQGPPGREPKSFNESLLPFRDMVHHANFLAHNLARHDSSKPQQEKIQQPKWLVKGLSDPLTGNVNYMQRSADNSGFPLLFSASDGPHFVPLPQDPSFSSLESFKDFWKPMTPVGSSQGMPPQVPVNAFQQWSSAADHQANGPNQPIQRDDGDRGRK